MSFWIELKRRKLFQVGAAYAVVGWLLVQVASAVFPLLQLPDWTATFVTILVIFFFPIALFLAWAYELTPEGIRRTVPVGGERSAASAGSILGYGVTGIVAASLGAGGYWLVGSNSNAEWLASTLTQIESHLDVADWEPAYALVREIQQRFPNNAELAALWTRVSWNTTIPSEPAGAAVYRRGYGSEDEWQYLGITPLENIRIPFGLSELRLELEGYRTLFRTVGGEHLNWETLEGPAQLFDGLLVAPETYQLDTEDSLPADKVRVSGWTFVTEGEDLVLQDFFLGRYEVTNAEYEAFIDDGGYERQNLWEPITVADETISLEEALDRALFTDRTGRIGPAAWSAGDYADGEGDLPVSGVSWYEASAYARWANAELPSVHHWQQALANSTFPWQLPLSNFSASGPRPVTASRAMSYTGAFDMVGNVREWAANSIGDEKVILGGNWNDANLCRRHIRRIRAATGPFRRQRNSPGSHFRFAAGS